MAFAVGDQVKLVGVPDCPPLTVAAVREYDVTCRWFGAAGVFQQVAFHESELEPAAPAGRTGHGPHVKKGGRGE